MPKPYIKLRDYWPDHSMQSIYEALVEELGIAIEAYGSMDAATRFNEMPRRFDGQEWEYCCVEEDGSLVCFGEGYLKMHGELVEKVELSALGIKKRRVYEDDETYKRVVL